MNHPLHFSDVMLDDLRQFIEDHPDRSQLWIARECGVAASTIWRVIQMYGIDRGENKGGRPCHPETLRALAYLRAHPDADGRELIERFNLPKYGRDATKALHWLRQKTGMKLPARRKTIKDMTIDQYIERRKR